MWQKTIYAINGGIYCSLSLLKGNRKDRRRNYFVFDSSEHLSALVKKFSSNFQSHQNFWTLQYLPPVRKSSRLSANTKDR